MAGNQSRGLIQASKTKGWDPTVIEGGESIANFDKDQGNLPGRHVGRLPGGTPDGWPDGYDVPAIDPNAVDFASPQPSGNEDRRTSGADPTPGKPGA